MLLMCTAASREESSWETLEDLPVPKEVTRDLEKDFLQGRVVMGQRGMGLN